MSSFQPNGPRVALVPVEPPSETDSGLYVHKRTRTYGLGKVVAVGPGKLCEDGSRKPVGVEVGETVMFERYANRDIKVDGEELMVVRERKLWAVVEDDAI